MATAVIPQREIIRFRPGNPETVVLKYANGREVQGAGGPQFMFSTVDNRIFFLDPDVAYNVEQCATGAGQGEPITITKYKGARNTTNWDIRPAGGPAVGRATPPPAAPPSELETKLRASIDHAQASRHPEPEASVQQPVTTAQAKLLAALCVAIDSCVEAKAYAQRRGLPLEFTGEDVRCFANTVLINAERGR